MTVVYANLGLNMNLCNKMKFWSDAKNLVEAASKISSDVISRHNSISIFWLNKKKSYEVNFNSQDPI